MSTSPLAGLPAPASLLIDVAQLERDYYQRRPNVADPNQLVSFGTSGHRGTPLDGTFTEAHILAISQAICEYRAAHGVDGPLFLGKDTHAVSARPRTPPWKCWPPTASPCASRPTTAIRPPR